MTKLLKAALAATALIGTPALAADPVKADLRLQRLLAGRTAGEPVNCIPFSAIRSSEIIDGRAIVYRAGAKLYVNEPVSGARWLNDRSILVTNTSSSHLCSVDTVRLIDRLSFFDRGSVALGKFVPYEKPRG